MSDPVVISVDPGTQEVGQVAYVAGDLVAVMLMQQPQQPIVPVQVGALVLLPGYEHAWQSELATHLHPGQRVMLTWIGKGTSGIMQASLLVQGQTLDWVALQEGWALPAVSALSVPGIGSEYRAAVQAAAHQVRGAFGDAQIAHPLRQEAMGLVGTPERALSPTYFAAHPALCFSLVLAICAVVAISMQADNQAVLTKNAQGGSSLQRGLRWALDLHLRFVRPRGFERQKDDQHVR